MIRLIIQWLPMFEVLFFNLFSLDFCAHRKYSALKTMLLYLGFTAVFFGAWVSISRLLSLDSDTRSRVYSAFSICSPPVFYTRSAPTSCLLFYVPPGSIPWAS